RLDPRHRDLPDQAHRLRHHRSGEADDEAGERREREGGLFRGSQITAKIAVMRGRVAAILLLFLCSVPAFPQCNLSPVYSGQFRASILDVAADNNDLWAATSYGVALYDRTVD